MIDPLLHSLGPAYDQSANESSNESANTATGPAIYLIIEALDMRLGTEGLSARVQTRLNRSPCAGDIYVFTNARRNRIKLLLWDATGVWLAQRRLHKGKFFWPLMIQCATATATATLTHEQWSWLTQGVDWSRLSASVGQNAHWRVA